MTYGLGRAAANSYYFDKNGDVPLRPTTTLESALRSRRFDLGDYRFTAVAAAPANIRRLRASVTR